MKHEWKPGDVAIIEVGCHASRFVGMFTHRGWRYGPDKWVADDPAIVTARPLAVIDPEDREQVERLTRAYWRTDDDVPTQAGIDNMQKVLREFANPTLPKPEEPTGLGAVVEDSDGWRWVRVDDPSHSWVRSLRDEGAYTQRAKWDHIDVVRVLSEGVTA